MEEEKSKENEKPQLTRVQYLKVKKEKLKVIESEKKKNKKKKKKPKGAKVYRVPKNKPPKQYSEQTFETFDQGPIMSDKRFKDKKSGKIEGNIISVGEAVIEKVLKLCNINYEREHIFSDCTNPKTNHPLRFDFYLPDYNTCIEFDGKQHYIASKELHGKNAKSKLKSQIYRDNIKTKYCKDNKINLIRFNYKQYKYLEKKVEAEISKLVKIC